MKTLCVIFSVFLVSFAMPLHSQIIPNGSFEEWDTINNRIELGGGWFYGTPTKEHSQRSEESVDGAYSFKFLDNVSTGNCILSITKLLPVNFKKGESYFLSFYMKKKVNDSLYPDRAYTWVKTVQINSNTRESIDWYHWDTLSEFTLFEVPLLDIQTDTLVFSIIGGGSSWDCSGISEMWVDDVRIISPTSISENINLEYEIFPNPASTELRINVSQEPEVVWIKNLNGEVMKELRNSSVIQVGELPPAMYLIEWEHRNGKRFIQKWVKL